MPGSYLPILESGKWSCVRSPCREGCLGLGPPGSIPFKGEHGEWSRRDLPPSHLYLYLDVIYSPTKSVCACVCVLVAQSCPTLCDPIDCSLPASSIYRILQARRLKRVVIPFSRGSSRSHQEVLPWEGIHVYVWLSHSAVCVKLSQHC